MQVIERALEASKAREPQAEQFHQAAREVLTSIEPLLKAEPALAQGSLLQRLIEPERQIIFRVPWRDDDGEVQVSRGFRIEHNSALGPYKGGLRFRPGLKVDELRFLAFEQTFKNALTQMPLGAGKGGADVDLRGASDEVLMGFCQSFMTELHRHIGLYTDVPAGDIGVGSKAIGYLFGQYKRLSKHMTPPLTGKPLESGGIPMREEATGFGAVYFAQHMAKDLDGELSGKRCVVSGAGNVALHAAKKLIEIGATVVAMSDSKGSIHKSSGLSADDLDGLMACKAEGGSVGDWAKDSSADFEKGSSVWGLSLKMDAAFPCAFQNEIDGEAAKAIASGGCEMVVEGANMPCTAEALEIFRDKGVRHGPGKAANAGGVAVSGLEMRQHATLTPASREAVDQQLRDLMGRIHDQCRDTAAQYGHEGDLSRGANMAGFERVARAMLSQGVV